MQKPTGPHSGFAFRDKYLAAIGIAVLMLISFFATAQKFQYPNPGTWGTQEHRRAPDSTFYFPTGCGVPTDSTSLFSQGFGAGQKLSMAAQYYDSCGHHFYLWDPSLRLWHVADSSSAGGPDSAISGRNGVKVTIVGTTRYLDADSAYVATRARLQKSLDSINFIFLHLSDSTKWASFGRLYKVRDSLMLIINASLGAKLDTTARNNLYIRNQGTGVPLISAHDSIFQAKKLFDTSRVSWHQRIVGTDTSVYALFDTTGLSGGGGPDSAVNPGFAMHQSITGTTKTLNNDTASALQPGVISAPDYVKLHTPLIFVNDSAFTGVDTATYYDPATNTFHHKGNVALWGEKQFSTQQVIYHGPDSLKVVSWFRLYKTMDSLGGIILKKGDSTAFASFARLYKVVDSLNGVMIHKGDSAGVGYTTLARTRKVIDSLGALIAAGVAGLSRDTALKIADSVGRNRVASYINLYHKGYWKDGSDFTITGMTPTYSADSTIVLPTGSSDFSQYMTVNGLTNNDENTAIEVIVKLTSAPTSGFKGFSVGWKSVNSWFPSSFAAGVDFGYASTLMRFNDVLGFTWSDSIGGLVAGSLPSSGDYVRITLIRTGNTISMTYMDITANSIPVTLRATANLQASGFGSNWFLPNSGNFCLWNHGGAGMNIVSMKLYSLSDPTPNILAIGDSKLAGNGQQSTDARSMGRVRSNLGSITMAAGPGDRTADILADTAYIKKFFKPKQVLINIGRNDVGSGVSAATYEANYAAIYAFSARIIGDTPVHLMPIPETNISQTTLFNWINSTYTKNKIDVTALWNNTTDLAQDNIHPTPLGGSLIAKYIIASGLFPTANLIEYPDTYKYIAQVASASIPTNLVHLNPAAAETGFINPQFLRMGSFPNAALVNANWIAENLTGNVMFALQNTNTAGYSGFNFVNDAGAINCSLAVPNSATGSDAGNLSLKTYQTGQNIDFYAGTASGKGSNPDVRVTPNGEVQINTKVEHSSKFNLNGSAWINKDSVAISSAGTVMAAGIDSVSGKLVRFTPAASGFTNPMTTIGDIIYGGTSGAATRLAGNTNTARQFYTSTGTGSAATAPTLGALLSGDIPANAANTSGTAANLSGTPTLPTGTKAATGSVGAGGTNVATQDYVDALPVAKVIMGFDHPGISSSSSTDVSATLTVSGTFRVGGYLNVTSLSVNTALVTVSWTDINSVSRSYSFTSSIATTGFYPLQDVQIRALTGTSISMGVTFTGAGSQTYDFGTTVEKLR